MASARVARRRADQHPTRRFTVLEDVGHTVRVSCDQGQPTSHRLQWSGRLAFASRGENVEISARQNPAHL